MEEHHHRHLDQRWEEEVEVEPHLRTSVLDLELWEVEELAPNRHTSELVEDQLEVVAVEPKVEEAVEVSPDNRFTWEPVAAAAAAVEAELLLLTLLQDNCTKIMDVL